MYIRYTYVSTPSGDDHLMKKVTQYEILVISILFVKRYP